MSETPKCTSWLGHKFEGRFSFGAPKPLTDMEVLNTNSMKMPSAIRAKSAKTYVRDICVRCGFVIERRTS